jgi:lysophospholipase L1-like esterase
MGYGGPVRTVGVCGLNRMKFVGLVVPLRLLTKKASHGQYSRTFLSVSNMIQAADFTKSHIYSDLITLTIGINDSLQTKVNFHQ